MLPVRQTCAPFHLAEAIGPTVGVARQGCFERRRLDAFPLACPRLRGVASAQEFYKGTAVYRYSHTRRDAMRSARKMRLVCFGAMGVSLTLLSTLFAGTADATNKPGLNSGKPPSLDDRLWKASSPLVAAANRIHDAADEGQAQTSGSRAGVTVEVHAGVTW